MPPRKFDNERQSVLRGEACHPSVHREERVEKKVLLPAAEPGIPRALGLGFLLDGAHEVAVGLLQEIAVVFEVSSLRHHLVVEDGVADVFL